MEDLERIYFSSNVCIDRIAFTREDVLELKRDLPILCPPADTTEVPPTAETTPETCAASCVDLIQENEAVISSLQEQVEAQDEVIADLSERLAAMERKLEEILNA